jgi:peptidoglycan hydrolase CwlO-like protein
MESLSELMQKRDLLEEDIECLQLEINKLQKTIEKIDNEIIRREEIVNKYE